MSVTYDKPSYEEMVDWLTSRVARALNVAPETIDVDIPLADYGIDSAASLALCADLESEKRIGRTTSFDAVATTPGTSSGVGLWSARWR